MTATIEMNDELSAFIEYYRNNATKSCWLRVYDHPSENPDDKRFIDPLALLDTEARSLLKKEQDKLRSLDKLSLCRQMGLNKETYTSMMVTCRWFNLRANGIRVQQGNIRNLFTTLNIEAELDSVQPDGCRSKCWWIQLGPTQEGYDRSVINQDNAQDFMPTAQWKSCNIP